MTATDAPARDALIVTGGQGTRLRPLTLTTRKELLPLCGLPFLAGVIRRLAAAGIERVLLVAGSDTAPFAPLHDDARTLGVELEVVPEPEPLDTAGGVRSVVDRVRSPFLVLNGDILTDVDYRAVVDEHRAADADATLVLTTVDDTSSYGVCVREGDRITSFVEKPAPGTLPGQNSINAGTYVLERHVFDGLPEGRLSFERQVFPALLERGQHIHGVVWDGVWADLGTPERFRQGHRLALRGELDWPGVASVPERSPGVRVDPSAEVSDDAVLVAPVLVGARASLGPGSTVGPDVVVGEGSAVGADARLSDSVLFADVTVGRGVAATGLVAGTRSSIADGARLGRGVVLGDGARVAADDVLQDGERVPPRTA